MLKSYLVYKKVQFMKKITKGSNILKNNINR